MEMRNPEYDLGLMELDTPLGAQLGWMGIVFANGTETLNLHNTGYPVDENPPGSQWWTFCNDIAVDFSQNQAGTHPSQPWFG